MSVFIHLLGSFRVTVDGVAVDEAQWGRRKSKTLMKLLALQPMRQTVRQMHREELMEFLWPGADTGQALNSLHKTLYAARRVLEPGLTAGGASKYLQMRDQLVVFQCADDVVVDVSEFEALADAALKTGNRDSLSAALSIWQGDLLPEDLYEDWSSVRREQLRTKREQLLLRLAAVCEETGDSRQGIEAWQSLIAANPCNEEAHRGLMRLYFAEGQRYLAVNQFRDCADVLRRDLDTEPEPATVALYQRLLAASDGPVGTVGPVTTTSESPSLPQTRFPPSSLSRAIRLWHVAAAIAPIIVALAAYLYLHRKPNIDFVAIMPFATSADSRELGYVADGITESVINNLSQLRQIRVMARSTVYRYRSKGLDPMAAAAAMKVHAMLTGTISKRGNSLLVNAELVGVPEGTRLWGKRYMLTATDLSSIQDRISSEIAAALGLRLGGDDRARLMHAHTTDPETYRLYLQARFFWNQRTRDGYLRSIELFKAAIARDPDYAPAFAGLADSYSFLGRDEAPTTEYMKLAWAADERALALDDKLAEAHASLAVMSNVYQWDFPAADRGFRRALELDPGYANAHLFYGVFLTAQGDFKQAQVQLDQAAQLDPLSPIIALCRGYPAAFQGNVKQGILAAREALTLSPNFPSALEDLMNYFEREGRLDDAMAQSVALLHARMQHELAEAVAAEYRKSGYLAAVRLWLGAEERRAAKEYVSPLRLALLAIRAGDNDKAFAWLDKAVADRNAGLVYLNTDPKYARLRSDARFARLVRVVGLTPRP